MDHFIGDGAVPFFAPRARRLAIRFTGSGSEYFRIWIVNVLLTIVTFGLYYPWAKARKLRYFYGNTLVADSPLDFHGDPKKMLRGFLLVAAMFVLYSVAGQVSALAGLVALVALAALWPALMRASLQFRLANTSWRGLRLRFSGTLRGAYVAMLPLYVAALAFVGLPLLVSVSPEAVRAPAVALGPLLAVAMLVASALIPYGWFKLKKYQHDHYQLGQVQTRLRLSPGAFYGLSIRTGLVTFVTGAVAAVLVGLVAFALHPGDDEGSPASAMFVTVLSGLTFYGITWVVAVPYMTSRMQNLLWDDTVSDELRFRSDLAFGPLAAVTLKNLLLMLVTLGLYWPFAKVAVTRLRMEAVAIDSCIDPEALFVARPSGHDDAAGEAVGDLFGIDIGL